MKRPERIENVRHIVSVIDVGSNSVRLMTALVEDTRVTPLEKELATTRLIYGMKDSVLTDEAIERTARAIAGFVDMSGRAGSERIDIFGTSAMRDASNADALNDRLEELCGRRVSVISGEEEAALAFAGAAPAGKCGVIDIGGGSTEMICGEDGKSACALSAPVGAVRLMDALPDQTPPEKMVEAAEKIIEPCARTIAVYPVEKWMGVGGTITTLAAMDKKVSKYTPGAIENWPVTLENTLGWLDRLCAMNLAERRGLVGLPERRADIIPYGAAILAAVMRRLGLRAVHACDHDNLEGYIRRHMMRSI